ncbi:hypothetical protein ABID56_000243 [Alkalibacillus flavidus]|uniref:Helix-turn-helix domain of resolvase n=1 Tax=Alkalibacillus flavidus TaxID=546021 RepID=A0ABV2KS24_9BACI
MEIFSLILHGVAFMAILFLYQKLRQATENEREADRRIQEIEDLFNSYLLEIKDENRKLLDEMSKIEQHPTKTTPQPSETFQSQHTSEPVYQPPQQHVSQRYQPSSQTQRDETEKQAGYDIASIIDEKQDYVEINQPDYGQYESPRRDIFQLYDQGYSIEAIAKQLDMGYTEVELIVKFHYKMTQ